MNATSPGRFMAVSASLITPHTFLLKILSRLKGKFSSLKVFRYHPTEATWETFDIGEFFQVSKRISAVLPVLSSKSITCSVLRKEHVL